jgi:HSP20 family protein
MAVTQYRPTAERFGPLFEEIFSRPVPQGGRMRDLLRTPEADVVETEKDIRVLLDVPGMRPEDIEIGLENNLLSVSGERRPEWSESEGQRVDWHLSECRYGKFSRSFVLPRDVDADRIEAHVEDGVLRLSIPKNERARRRRIEIRSNGRSQEVGTGAD